MLRRVCVAVYLWLCICGCVVVWLCCCVSVCLCLWPCVCVSAIVAVCNSPANRDQCLTSWILPSPRRSS